jgi:thioredoxin:protein disulfide reductase
VYNGLHMKSNYVMRYFTYISLGLGLLLIPANFLARSAPQSAPNIAVTGQLANNSVRRGRSVQATLVMDIPSGFHVNSSKPLEKFLVPTQLQVEAPKGIRVGPINYPRAVLRSFKFSKSKVSVYEGRATMRFNVTVPAGYSSGSAELKARLRYQSCNEESCFPPQTKEVSLSLGIN